MAHLRGSESLAIALVNMARGERTGYPYLKAVEDIRAGQGISFTVNDGIEHENGVILVRGTGK
jgi:hypothetical protein